jgi:5-methyltetrahydrofolate--homocysteine methyltransferase
MQRVLENPEKRMTGALAYLADLITSQVIAGADYIDINVDAFPDAVRPRMMRYYVDLVNSLSKGVPVCVDSSDPATKAAGIDQYFKTARNPEALPVLNSIRPVHPKHVLELRERYPFRVVAMLHERVDENGSPAAVESVEEVHALARDMFRVLTGSGFEPGDIFFDTAVCPIAADIEAKRTYLTMHGIRAIMSDPQMSGVHTVIGLTNASHMMPNRLSLNRSYLRVAMEYGLTAAVLDPRVNYGERDPGRQSLDIIQRLAENDGSDLAASMEIFEAIAEYSRRYGSRRRRGGEDG